MAKGRKRSRRKPVPVAESVSQLELTPQQTMLNNLSRMFALINEARPVIERRIQNYTQEDLERMTADVIRYQSQLIDVNNYAYMVFGLFRDLIDFYVKPILYRWTVNTRIKPSFDPQAQDQGVFRADYTEYSAKLNQLNLGRELHRILTKMFLEDVVCGYWIEDDESSTILYLPVSWCIIDRTVNGNWTYLLNSPRITEQDMEKLPPELQSLVRQYRQRSGKEAYAPIPFERVLCVKYNDHTNIVFPPMTNVLVLIINILRTKDLALTRMEQDVVNLIQMLIPIDDTQDDHLRLTDPIIQKFATGIQELLAENNAIIPTPMQLSVLDTNRSHNKELDVVENAMSAYHNETGVPRFGGTNTAAEMKKALENAASKVYVVLDHLADAVNIKMKLDGYVYNDYEFLFQILHMTKFNENEVVDGMLKQSQAGAVNKIALEAARGNNPSMLVGQHYTENVVHRALFDTLMVPPSSHTQTTGGRPEGNEDDLTAGGEQARADEVNNPDNRDG